jgi:hypothetical protein
LLFEVLGEVPQIEPRQKIRFGVQPLRVGHVSLLLPFGRPITGILHFEGRRNNQEVGQAALAICFNDHPPNSRIDRQPGQLPPNRRQPAGFIDSSQLEQISVAVADCFAARRIEKRKFVNGAQIQSEQLQDDSGQVRALNLGRGESLPAQVVFLAE